MTKEWQEASNKRALELKLDPISGALSSVSPRRASYSRADFFVFRAGISSEGYKGPGFVQSK